ncbi:hypothetical protein ACH4SK_07615 [Streptomyces inhibens]
MPVSNATNSPVVVFNQPGCAGNVIGWVPPLSNNFYDRGWSVRVMQ